MGGYFGLAVLVGVALLLATGQCDVNCRGMDGHAGEKGAPGRNGWPGLKGEKGEPGRSLLNIQMQLSVNFYLMVYSFVCLLCPSM